MDGQDAGHRRVHESECLLVERWILVRAWCCTGRGNRLLRTVFRHLIKLGQIISLIFDLILLKINEQFLGGLAAIILTEGVKVLDAIVNKLINLEQEMGLVSK